MLQKYVHSTGAFTNDYNPGPMRWRDQIWEEGDLVRSVYSSPEEDPKGGIVQHVFHADTELLSPDGEFGMEGWIAVVHWHESNAGDWGDIFQGHSELYPLDLEKQNAEFAAKVAA